MEIAKKEFDIPMVLEPEFLASPYLDDLSGEFPFINLIIFHRIMRESNHFYDFTNGFSFQE